MKMIRYTLPLLIASLAFSVVLPARGQDTQKTQETDKVENAPEKEKSVIETLAWLAGSWSGEEDGATTDEMWMLPGGGTMFGINRVVVGGRTAAVEQLRIVETKGVVSYFAGPAGAEPTEFRLKTSDESSVIFENLKHDFPQRIIYRREEDRLTARIEGKMGDEMQAMEWHWEKSK